MTERSPRLPRIERVDAVLAEELAREERETPSPNFLGCLLITAAFVSGALIAASSFEFWLLIVMSLVIGSAVWAVLKDRRDKYVNGRKAVLREAADEMKATIRAFDEPEDTA